MSNIIEVPQLDHDRIMVEQYGQKYRLDGRKFNERLLIAALVAHLSAAGFTLDSIFDGDEDTKVKTTKDAMELIFNLDESWLRFRKDTRTHAVYVILGNGNDGKDLIADYNYSSGDPDGFDAAMKAFDADKVVEEHYNAIPTLLAQRARLLAALDAVLSAAEPLEADGKIGYGNDFARARAVLAECKGEVPASTKEAA